MNQWIGTEIGDLVVQLLHRERLRRRFSVAGRPRFRVGEPTVLTFAADSDRRVSEQLLGKTRHLVFSITLRPDGRDVRKLRSRKLYAYLGTDPEWEWRDDLSFELVYAGQPEPDGTGWRETPRWESTDERADSFRAALWCAGFAPVTLCLRPGRPIKRADGTPLRTEIALGYSGTWYRGLYDGVLAELEREQEAPSADITSSIRGFRRAMDRARRRGGGSPSLELYHRLRIVLPKYERRLADIAQRPVREPQARYAPVALNALDAGVYFREPRAHLQCVDVQRGVQTLTRPVPLTFGVVEPMLTLDTPANRYVRRSARTVAALIEQVETEVAAYMAEIERAKDRFLRMEHRSVPRKQFHEVRKHEENLRNHSVALSTLAAKRRRLEALASMIPADRDPSHGFEAVIDSATLSFDGRYAELRRYTDRLRDAIAYVDHSTESYPFQVEAFSTLYERWCFDRVITALKLLGFRLAAGTSREVMPFYHHPRPHEPNYLLQHDALLGVRLEVWYSRRYPLYGARPEYTFGLELRDRQGRTDYRYVRNGRPLPKAKLTPDISLEFYAAGETVPTIITLDPTLSQTDEQLREKYEYRDAIRSFLDEHRSENGESRRIVEAAWAICPGREGDQRFILPERSARPDYRHGRIVLRPDPASMDALTGSLATILEQRKITPHLLTSS